MTKRFGQNFLTNRDARERILAEVLKGLDTTMPDFRLWEIGPGIGAMSAMVLEAGLSLTAFEIDHGFVRLLQRVYGADPRFRLLEGDFLDTWQTERETAGPPPSIFGNLPYNVANVIVASLIEGGLVPPRMVFTLQKEAAIRMGAKIGTKDYSAFSVLCTSACKVRLAFDLGANSFWPAPNVTSTVVVLEPRRVPICPNDRKGFSNFVRSGFASRRKTFKNNLKAKGRTEAEILAAFESLGIREDIRAEALTPESLAALYEALRGPALPIA